MRQHFLKERRPGGKEERAVHPAKHWVRCWQQFAGWERLMVGAAPPPLPPAFILTELYMGIGMKELGHAVSQSAQWFRSNWVGR